jgi:hypothetical protein
MGPELLLNGDLADWTSASDAGDWAEVSITRSTIVPGPRQPYSALLGSGSEALQGVPLVDNGRYRFTGLHRGSGLKVVVEQGGEYISGDGRNIGDVGRELAATGDEWRRFEFEFVTPEGPGNLILNPTDEDWPPIGVSLWKRFWSDEAWGVSTGTRWSTLSGYHSNGGHNGSSSAFAPGGRATAELWQERTVHWLAPMIDAGEAVFRFSAWIMSSDPAEQRIEVEYRDAQNGTVLHTDDTGWETTDTAGEGGDPFTWVERTFETTAPVGTRSIRVRLSTKQVGTAWCPAYFDDITLTPPIRLRNLVVNPSDEMAKINTNLTGYYKGSTQGWVDGGAWGVPDNKHWQWYTLADPTIGKSGSHFFQAGGQIGSPPPELYQDIDVSALATSIDAETETFYFSAFWGTLIEVIPPTDNAHCRIKVEYRDAGGTVLHTDDTGELTHTMQTPNEWSEATFETVAPADTRTIRIRLVPIYHYGTYVHGYYDDITLVSSSGITTNWTVGVEATDNGYVAGLELHRVWAWQTAEPRLAEGSLPTAYTGTSDIFFGGKRGGGGQLTVLIGDGLLDDLLSRLDLLAQEVAVLVGGAFDDGQELTLEDHRYYLTGMIRGARSRESASLLELDIQDARELMFRRIPQRSYAVDQQDLEPRVYGKRVPLLWGHKTNLTLAGIRYAANGYRTYEICDTWSVPTGIKAVDTLYSYVDQNAANLLDTTRRFTATASVDYSVDLIAATLTVLRDVRAIEIILGQNDRLDFSTGRLPLVAALTPGTYGPHALATLVQEALGRALSGEAGEDLVITGWSFLSPDADYYLDNDPVPQEWDGTTDDLSDNTSAAVAITSSSVANPSVITTPAAHGLSTGDHVTISGHTGSTPSINGEHVATYINATTFSIPVNVTVGGTGGTFTTESFMSVTGDGTDPTVARCLAWTLDLVDLPAAAVIDSVILTFRLRYSPISPNVGACDAPRVYMNRPYDEAATLLEAFTVTDEWVDYTTTIPADTTGALWTAAELGVTRFGLACLPNEVANTNMEWAKLSVVVRYYQPENTELGLCAYSDTTHKFTAGRQGGTTPAPALIRVYPGSVVQSRNLNSGDAMSWEPSSGDLVSTLADGDDATRVVPTGQWGGTPPLTFLPVAVPGSAALPVASVLLHMRWYNGQTTTDDRNRYPIMRFVVAIKGVQGTVFHGSNPLLLIDTIQIENNSGADGSQPGWIERDYYIPKPDGVSWTLGDVNAMEFGVISRWTDWTYPDNSHLEGVPPQLAEFYATIDSFSGPGFNILLKTGINKDRSGWKTLGFTDSEDKTGALTYEGDSSIFRDADRDHAFLRVDAQGFKDDAAGTYTGTANALIELGPDIIRHVWDRFLLLDPGLIDDASFVAARIDAAAPLGIYVATEQSILELFDGVEVSTLSDIVIDAEGRVYFHAYQDNLDGSEQQIAAHDIMDYDTGRATEDVYQTVIVEYDLDPTTDQPRTVQGEDTAIPFLFRRPDPRAFSTYLINALDASTLRADLQALAGAAPATIEIHSLALLDQRVGKTIRVTLPRDPFAAGGVRTAEALRILDLRQDLLNGKCSARLVVRVSRSMHGQVNNETELTGALTTGISLLGQINTKTELTGALYEIALTGTIREKTIFSGTLS